MTNSSIYPSRYSPDKYVTVAQYIIELLCENKAKTLKKDLPIKFWELPEWANFYKSQLRIVHKLLKEYSGNSIIAVIKNSTIWSLRPTFVINKIKAEEKRAAALEEQKLLDAKDRSAIDKLFITIDDANHRREHKSKLDNIFGILDD